MEIASIVGSIVSAILAVLAIGLSIFFYTQSKNTEANVEKALEAIRVQTNSLQQLTGRWMDRLTRYVTSPQARPDDLAERLVSAVKALPTDIASQLTPPTAAMQGEALAREVVTSYVALYYYTAVANVWSQFLLPPLERFDETPQYSEAVKRIVDTSCADFKRMAQILGGLNQEVVDKVPVRDMLDEALKVYRPLVKDSTQVYAQRADEAGQGGA